MLFQMIRSRTKEHIDQGLAGGLWEGSCFALANTVSITGKPAQWHSVGK